MDFDKHGHEIWSPQKVYHRAKSYPIQLINRYLMCGTPWAFSEYEHYGNFLEAVAERTGVPPRNMYLRGSCQLGFSIAPTQRAWMAMRSEPGKNPSDLDLVIVDEAYFTKIERDVRWWEERNPGEKLQGAAAEGYRFRQQDRLYDCCRDSGFPSAICVHHKDAMRRVEEQNHCGIRRSLSAFIYPDWFSARRRYEFDLRELVKKVESGEFPKPSDEPLSEKSTFNR